MTYALTFYGMRSAARAATNSSKENVDRHSIFVDPILDHFRPQAVCRPCWMPITGNKQVHPRMFGRVDRGVDHIRTSFPELLHDIGIGVASLAEVLGRERKIEDEGWHAVLFASEFDRACNDSYVKIDVGRIKLSECR